MLENKEYVFTITYINSFIRENVTWSKRKQLVVHSSEFVVQTVYEPILHDNRVSRPLAQTFDTIHGDVVLPLPREVDNNKDGMVRLYWTAEYVDTTDEYELQIDHISYIVPLED